MTASGVAQAAEAAGAVVPLVEDARLVDDRDPESEPTDPSEEFVVVEPDAVSEPLVESAQLLHAGSGESDTEVKGDRTKPAVVVPTELTVAAGRV